MKLNKLFPKKKMDEIFTKFGFTRGKATDGFIYVNEFNTFVGIGRHRFKNGVFLLDTYALSVYNLNVDGFKHEWKEEEYQDCIRFIENSLLPHISHLKGPFKISPQYYFNRIEELFSKYIQKGGEKGNMDFDIPVDNNEVVQINYDFLKFVLEEGTTLFFLNHHSIYEILIIDQFSSKKHFNWHRFADKDKEGDELLIQMVENIAVFLKLKE